MNGAIIYFLFFTLILIARLALGDLNGYVSITLNQIVWILFSLVGMILFIIARYINLFKRVRAIKGEVHYGIWCVLTTVPVLQFFTFLYLAVTPSRHEN